MMFFPVGDEVGVQVLGRKLFSSSFLPTQSSLEIALKKIQPTPPPDTPPHPLSWAFCSPRDLTPCITMGIVAV